MRPGLATGQLRSPAAWLGIFLESEAGIRAPDVEVFSVTSTFFRGRTCRRALHRRASVAFVMTLLCWIAPTSVRADSPVLLEATAHDTRLSISIDSDAAFARSDSGVRSGSGTAEDPYVISNWTVLHDRRVAIDIAHTTSHVVIEDVYVGGFPDNLVGYARDCDPELLKQLTTCRGSVGIQLTDVRNVTIRRARVATDTRGFIVRDSSDVTIQDVRLGDFLKSTPAETTFENHRFGMMLYNVSDVLVSNLSVQNSFVPLWAAAVNRLTIERSRFVGDLPDPDDWNEALLYGPSSGVTFRDNVFDRVSVEFGHGSYGHLEGGWGQTDLGPPATRVAFVGNTWLSGAGLGNYWSDYGQDQILRDVYVCGNTFEGQTVWGVYLENADRITVRSNRFLDQAHWYFAAVWITDNFGSRTDSYVRVEENLFKNSSGNGLLLNAVRNATVRHNAFENNVYGESITGGWAGVGVDARENWWGDPTGPGAPLGSGNGDPLWTEDGWPWLPTFSPWLSEAPDLSQSTCDGTPWG